MVHVPASSRACSACQLHCQGHAWSSQHHANAAQSSPNSYRMSVWRTGMYTSVRVVDRHSGLTDLVLSTTAAASPTDPVPRPALQSMT